MQKLENLKNYEHIKKAMDHGDNVIVVTQWAAMNIDGVSELTSPYEIYFYEKETEKAILFVNEWKDKKIWLPKSQVIYYEKTSVQITRVFAGIVNKE